MKTKKVICFISTIIISSLLYSSCTSLDMAISKKIDISKKLKKIAVFPFKIKGVKWGDEFADAISHNFFKSGRIEVVEREAIEKVFKEQRLSMSGLVDTKKATRLGKLFGADVILIGHGKVLRKDYKRKDVSDMNLIDTFTLKAINVETGALLITVRKEPGIAWNTEYKVKMCAGLGCIWSRNDILRESSTYDDISRQIVGRILEAIDKIEAEKLKAKTGKKS